MEATTNRLELLRKQLQEWNDAYYRGEALVPDATYDKAYQELKALEIEAGVSSDITQKVGSNTKSDQALSPHWSPMLSLYTEVDSSVEGFKRFYDRVTRELGKEQVELVAQIKLDGLGLNFQYEQGMLKRVLTRYDGEMGEDVTRNLALFCHDGILGVPTEIPLELGSLVEIRGEGIMSIAAFNKLNELLEENNKTPKVNPRNAAAGLMRTKKLPEEYHGLMQFIPYALHPGEDATLVFDTELSKIDYLRKLQFSGGVVHTVPTGETGHRAFTAYEEQRFRYPYEIDGVVFKVNKISDQDKLGWRSREPRWAIAQKFVPTMVQTVLEGIDIQVGRTGKVTPVARVKPVFVGGTTVSNVTLHNVFDLRRRNVRVGDTVSVNRAGDVIPEICYRPHTEKRPFYRPNFRMPKKCPLCGCGIIRPKGDSNYFCSGKGKCQEQVIYSLLHYVGRDCMAIKGIGEETIRNLVGHGLIKSPVDFYTLDKDDYINKGGIAPANWPKIEAELGESLGQKDWRFVAGLGIKLVGIGSAKRLCRNIPLKELPNKTVEELLKVPDIGEDTANSIYQYFRENGNDRVFNYYFWALGAEFESTYQPEATGKFAGKVFAFSGSFKSPSREELKTLVEQHGGTVGGSPGKSTSYFVVGESPTAHKVEKAKSLSIPVITVQEFLGMI